MGKSLKIIEQAPEFSAPLYPILRPSSSTHRNKIHQCRAYGKYKLLPWGWERLFRWCKLPVNVYIPNLGPHQCSQTCAASWKTTGAGDIHLNVNTKFAKLPQPSNTCRLLKLSSSTLKHPQYFTKTCNWDMLHSLPNDEHSPSLDYSVTLIHAQGCLLNRDACINADMLPPIPAGKKGEVLRMKVSTDIEPLKH